MQLNGWRRALGAGVLALAIGAAGPVAAGEALTGDEIRALIGGNTIEGAMVATGPYAEFYQADGTIKGKDYTGAWSVEGDTMCFQYGSDPKSCWRVVREGDAIQWVNDGTVDGTGTVSEGNPNKF